jgi:hypothetical protein
MFFRTLMFAAIAICGAVPAWGQGGPKTALPIFREAPGQLARELYGPKPSPEVIVQACGAKCGKPCANWASWQTDFQFSYDACVAKCRNKDFPWCP